MRNLNQIKVYLNADHEEDRRILDFLPYAGVSTSKAFKTAMLRYIDYKNGDYQSDPFLQAVRKIIREELKEAQIQVVSQQAGASTQPDDADIEVDPLAFLDELENMAQN